MQVRGIGIASVPEALLATASVLGLLDQVVLIDSALHQQLCTRAELDEICSRPRRGVRPFRAALALADGRSESAWETMLRVLHVACGIPVTPQVVLRDNSGRFVARVDLVVDETGDPQEYDGAGHRTAAELRKDLARDRGLADLGRPRRAWTAPDLLFRPADILAPIAARLGRLISVAPWLALLADSLYTDSGREAFERRLGRSLKWPQKSPDDAEDSGFGAT